MDQARGKISELFGDQVEIGDNTDEVESDIGQGEDAAQLAEAMHELSEIIFCLES